MMRSPGGGSASRSRYAQWCCGQPCRARTGRPSGGPASVTWNRTPRASTNDRRTPSIGGASSALPDGHESDYREQPSRYRAGMAGYRELFDASIADPTAFWADAARAVTWTREPKHDPRRLQPAVLPVVPRRRAQHLRQRAGPPRRRRPRRPAGADLRLAGDRHAAHLHLPRTAGRDSAVRRRAARPRRRQGRPRRHLHADDSRGRDRDAGLRAARRRALGGVRRVRRARTRGAHRRRPSGRHRVGVVRHRADPDRRLQADARRRARDRRARPARVRHRAARAAPVRAARGPRPRLARADGRRGARRPGAGRGHRPAVRALHLGHDRASPRASSATTAGTRWRCCGACATSTTPHPAKCSGPPPMSAGWSATPTSCTAPLLLGATTVLYEGKPVGTPDAGAFWRVASEHGVKALFTAPTAIRAIKKEDPDGSTCGKYDLSALKYLFQAGERLDPGTYDWASEQLGIPVVDHWWQTETGWAIAANPMGVERLADQARLADGADARLRRAHPAARRLGVRRRRRGRDLRQAAAAAGHPADAVGRRRPLRRVVPVGVPRLLPDRRRRLPRRGRLPVRDGPHRRRHQRCGTPDVDRDRSRRCLPRTRPSPSAR